MSEFLAEAKVLITPDTTKFRTQLQTQLLAATKSIKPIAIPVVPIVGGGAAGGVQQAIGAQKTLQQTTAQSTKALLGAGTATARLDAALLGLRTAIGSTAVIGLGALSLAAIAAGKAFRSMTLDAAAFEQELNTFQAVTGATADDMERVADAAAQLGADIRLPAVSSSDAAIAMTELAKAGLSVEDAIAGAAGVLQLATAAQISNAEASQIAANALNSFGLEGGQAVEVADALANAANAAQGNISDFGFAMRQASAVARQVGLGLQDTTALLSLFAKNGLSGSDAGTALRVALIRLVAPSKEAAAEIKNLGLQIRDAQGNLRADVFAQFGEATQALGPAARDAAAQLIFGQDAIRAVSIGAREGVDGLRLMQFQIDQTGTAAEVAAARTKGFAGEMEGLNSNLQTLGTSLGKVTNLFLLPLVRGMSEAARGANAFVKGLDALLDDLKRLGSDEVVGRGVGGFFSDLGERAGDLVRPITRFRRELGIQGDTSVDTARKIRTLTTELKLLEQARVDAEKGGAPQVADTLTIQIEALREQIKQLKKEAGEPVQGNALKPLEDSLARLEKAQKLQISIGADTTDIDAAIASLKTRLAEAAQGLTAGAGEANRMEQSLLGVASAADKASAAISNLTQQATRLGDELQAARIAGASRQTQIGILQQQRAAQFDIIAQAEIGGRQAGDITTIRKARDEIERIDAEIESLQNEIATEQKKATDSAKEAARKAARLREEQTKAFIEAFGGGRARRINQAQLEAGLTEDARDNLAADKRLKKFLLDKRKAIRERIRDLDLHGAALKAARDAIKKLNDEIDRINNDIARDQLDVAEQARDRARESIELDIDLAETQGNVRKEIAARRRLIRLLQQQLALTKRGTLEYKRIRNAIAEQNAAIEDAQKEQKKTKTLAQSQFQFLQSLQGFTANLLGNLIPGFATGGLVGGSGGGGGETPSSVAQMQARVQQSTAITGARERGVRPVQVDTTNALLRQILRTLQATNGRLGHPEARYQAGNAAANFDTVPGN